MVDTLEESDALPAISPEAPCGPDLDFEGDPEFLNYLAATEGQLPASYFDFDVKAVDFTAAEATGVQLLARTHDVRLLVLLAKLAILRRDIKGFARWVSAIAQLLTRQWDEVHPRGENGDFTARMAQLATLNDSPVVLLPLQYAPLAETQREGVLTFRARLVASGDANAREGERMPEAGAIERILANSDLPNLSATLRALQTIKSAIEEIKATTLEKAGVQQTVPFDGLTSLIERMTTFIQTAVAARDPSVAPPKAPTETASEEAGEPAAVSSFGSLAEADAALAAAFAYFAKNEPSSAAVLLIGQARQLLGKNIYEVMQIIAPDYAAQARIFVGSEPAFTVRVSSIAPAQEGEREQAAGEPAASRGAALSLVDSAAAYLRKAEPSNPAPLLLDRAKSLASRDFFGLLKELLSEDTLTEMRRNR
ncbi:MAG TPA: type VI secretion system ImpA family N-terminal domain-containing protein [Roseiarcus sp.]|nr:type VI secretion system ImpA family N-terminal domain-containing protein [Roseiarcus sp.]